MGTDSGNGGLVEQNRGTQWPARRLVVKITAIEPWDRRLGLGLVCICLAGYAWAQAPVANPSDAQGSAATAMASLEQPMVTAANKPHDDSFVIGNDDVLAIHVWKEPDLSRSVPV